MREHWHERIDPPCDDYVLDDSEYDEWMRQQDQLAEEAAESREECEQYECELIFNQP